MGSERLSTPWCFIGGERAAGVGGLPPRSLATSALCPPPASCELDAGALVSWSQNRTATRIRVMSESSTSLETLDTLAEDLAPRPMILPGENPDLYEALRDALLHDLAPRSPYQRILAHNLITLEWEAQRHRRMRDELIRAEMRDIAVGGLESGRLGAGYRATPEHKAMGHALVGPDRGRAEAAAQALVARGITLGELAAKAYGLQGEKVEVHEKKLADLETRRRRLREEYDRLGAARQRPVEDAEILEA